MYKEFIVEQLPDKTCEYTTSYQTALSDCAEKVKQLEAVLATEQLFFTWVRKSNKNTIKTSYEVVMLIVTHGKPFTFYCYKMSGRTVGS